MALEGLYEAFRQNWRSRVSEGRGVAGEGPRTNCGEGV